MMVDRCSLPLSPSGGRDVEKALMPSDEEEDDACAGRARRLVKRA